MCCNYNFFFSLKWKDTVTDLLLKIRYFQKRSHTNVLLFSIKTRLNFSLKRLNPNQSLWQCELPLKTQLTVFYLTYAHDSIIISTVGG